jgi:signal transduction histidine kinase
LQGFRRTIRVIREEDPAIVSADDAGAPGARYRGRVSRIRRIATRAQRLDAFAVDAALAGAIAVWAVVEFAVQAGSTGHTGLGIVGALCISLPLAWRRRAPVPVVVAVVGALIAVSLLGALPEDWLAPAVAILIATYSVGAHTRGAWPGVLVVALCLAAAGADLGAGNLLDFAISAGIYALLPFAVGRTLRNRRLLTRELRAEAERLQRADEERAREVVVAERARIARELHDVVAHGVSVMVIQAGGARRVARTDREAAREALRRVEASGREALAEMRRMVGVLRRGEQELAAAEPGMARLAGLVEHARAAGLPVELRVDGDPVPLPAGLDLAGYRVVQEALTNAIRHAGPARARVVVRWDADALELEVSDDGAGPRPGDGGPPAGGHGLVGMAERVALYGGRLDAGRRRGGGFAVRARLPLERGAA